MPEELLNKPKGIYKKNKKLWQMHLLSQYQIYMNRFDAEMDRTMKKENLYLGINSLFISGSFLSKNYLLYSGNNFIFITGFFIIICIIWFISMLNANNIKKSQLFILRKIEEKLPLQPLYFERNHTKWKNVKIKFGLIRSFLPYIFIFGYLFMIIVEMM